MAHDVDQRLLFLAAKGRLWLALPVTTPEGNEYATLEDALIGGKKPE